jgi:1-acyl-sn-glycerol-3-phosphate acyltransferase
MRQVPPFTEQPPPPRVDGRVARGLVPPPGWRPRARAPLLPTCRQVWTLARLCPGFFRTMTRDASIPIDVQERQASSRAVLRALGVSLEVLGAERVPAEGGLVLMVNQESHLDQIVLPAALPRVFLALYSHVMAYLPLYGAYLRNHGHFPVKRRDPAQWRASIDAAARAAQAGACVAVGPEGTRSWDGELLPMKRGAFALARAAQRPIVCMTIVGGHERLPRGAFTVQPGPMRVVFSEPIAVNGDAELEAVVARTFRATKAEHGAGIVAPCSAWDHA